MPADMGNEIQVSIVIATSNARVHAIKLPERVIGIQYVIVHQVFGDYIDTCLPGAVVSRNDVSYERLEGAGLSRSRNFGILASSGKYLYFMDDDVAFHAPAILAIVEIMQSEKIDVGTCMHRFENGSLARRYKKYQYKHNLLTLAKVSSIDICINLDAVRHKSIFFDERFGLGTSLPSGEEFIFLSDCWRDNLLMVFLPFVVGVHPNITSGADYYSTDDRVLAKREMLRRVFGGFFPLLLLAFWLKKSYAALKFGRFFRFTKVLITGVI